MNFPTLFTALLVTILANIGSLYNTNVSMEMLTSPQHVDHATLVILCLVAASIFAWLFIGLIFIHDAWKRRVK